MAYCCRRRPGIEEENALLSLARGNDYGYIPPGYGLNDHLRATMASIAGPCSCLKEEPTKSNAKSYAPIPTSLYDPAALIKQRVMDFRIISTIIEFYYIRHFFLTLLHFIFYVIPFLLIRELYNLKLRAIQRFVFAKIILNEISMLSLISLSTKPHDQ